MGYNENDLLGNIDISETSVMDGQIGGTIKTNNIFANQKRDNVNNLISMLTSESSDDGKIATSATNTELLEKQLKNILTQTGGGKKRSKKKSKKSKKKSKKRSKKRSKKQSGGKRKRSKKKSKKSKKKSKKSKKKSKKRSKKSSKKQSG